MPPPPTGPEPRRSDRTRRNVLIGLGVVVVLLVLAFAFGSADDGGSDDVATGLEEFDPGGVLPDPGNDPFSFPGSGGGLPFRPDSVAVGAGSVLSLIHISEPTRLQ